MDYGKRAAVGTAVFLACILALWGLIAGLIKLNARYAPQPGQIGVVRAGSSFTFVGDWFNGHNILKVVPPNSGSTNIGLGSTVHAYPSDSVQRNYTISATPGAGDLPGVDQVTVPSEDGINMSLEGTFYFTTAFNASPAGEALVKDFDNRFGVRTFALDPNSSMQLYPWQGTDGWEAFLNVVIRPIINNDLRRAIASVSCAQLVSSCALVHSQTVAALQGGASNNQNIQKIQDEINASLQQDIATTLGGKDYFSNIQFLLEHVTLPPRIQDQIEAAQAQYAAVGTAAAQVQQAKLQAQANGLREKGYQNCPACAAIDELKAIPSNVTTFAPGAGFAITAK